MDTLTGSYNGVTAIVEYEYTAKETDELDLSKGSLIHNIKIQPGGWWEGTIASSGRTGMFPDNFVRVLDVGDNDRSPVVLRDKSKTANRRCKVIYSYTQHNEDELSLVVGNVIEVLGEVEEGWWRGRIGEKIGVFPSNFVEVIETNASVTTASENAGDAISSSTSPILANKRPNSNTISSTTTTKKENNNRSSLHSSREDLLSSSLLGLDKDAPLLPPKPIREHCKVLFPYEPQNEDELELLVGEVITIINKELPDKGWWKGELRGKTGVFPDNFVTLLPSDVSPSKDVSQPDRPPPPGSSKLFIKKSGSGSSSQGSNRKDSFGSRDSLNDILNETGIITGNVAAQRKSLETKNFDISTVNNSGAAGAAVEHKAARRSLENKATEIRKSLENMEEKKTPPPVLTKKPVVPVKKGNSVTSVAGNLLSGLKQKVKSVEQKLSSHDTHDGGANSKANSQVVDNNEKGIIGEKHRKDDSEFDNVERGSMLQDMRARRVKAPKRRPPSAAINSIGENNNHNPAYMNGGVYTTAEQSDDEDEPKSDIIGGSGAIGEEELAKPKPREWERRKAPWMEELKLSQAKKTSPNVEPRATDRVKTSESLDTGNASMVSRVSTNSEKISDITNTKSITSSTSYSSSAAIVSSSTTSQRKSTESGSYEARTQSFESSIKRESGGLSNDMTKSMSAVASSKNASSSNLTVTGPGDPLGLDDIKSRPTSLSIRNRSVSPKARTSLGSGKVASTSSEKVSSTVNNSATSSLPPIAPALSATTKDQGSASTINHDNGSVRIQQLEKRVLKLEGVVQDQSTVIDALMRSLKEESDRVRCLQSELEKYAQCVTQV